MTYSYYPGCTLKTKAKDLDRFGRLSAEALGARLEELEDWQCCGAVYPQASDEIATKLSAIRALDAAKRKDQPLLTLCSACHHVIKRVNHDMQTDDNLRFKANNYLKLDEPYLGEARVVHYLEMLRDVSERVNVPVIASGGAGCIKDFVTLFKTLPRVDAGLAASIFHFGEVKIGDLKQALAEEGIPVRITK